ncbi:hypothetical protein [Halobacillus halophilus]|uniref:hypothetical protein n=1 Tax=Halobacillus halophilus TaxID=1570 RepID=UPI001CD2B8D6|nr:hypothetical protein [Halobacillus halophilus]MCA1012570.1 hypothetical protein [Halobacillus halophilus]
MTYSRITSLILIILLAGCIPQSDNVEVLQAHSESYAVYLYTELDNDNPSNADNYLTALLNWKKKHERKPLSFKQSEANTGQIEVDEDQLPALVVKKDGKVIELISGDSGSEDIMNKLESSISLTNKNS